MATASRPTRPARPTRAKPRQPLSRERIVQAALQLIEDEGLPAFSTRKLGERLHVEAMSIYHHFPSKQHLLDALVEHVIGTVDVPEPGPDPVASLREGMYAYRAMAHRFPALFPLVAVHRLNMPAGVLFIESIMKLFRAAAPDVESAARQFRAMGYYLMGACLDETSGYARGPSAAEPASDGFIREHCPHLMEAAPFFQRKHWDATFELGISMLLGAAKTSAPRRKRS
jgi:AcrR family transcriptional regulator